MPGIPISPSDLLSPEPASADAAPFLVVGVGASAGGLEAVTKLLEGLAPDSGMAVLVVLHLDPHFKSELPAILGRSCPLPVVEAAEGMRLAADRVYICPASGNIALDDGAIAMAPRPLRGANMPIDHLFRSLAEAHKSRSVGVVLSGDGTDGTLGLQTIKAEGGISFAQDEKSARHHSMPRAAALDGHVDFVLPPPEIAAELLRIARHSFAKPSLVAPANPAQADGAVEQVIGFVRANTNVDFTHYKRTTILRRIERRMALRGLEAVADYLKILRDDPEELRALYQDFLIRVTQFFRDPEAFEALAKKVFPALLEGRPADSPVRVWVSGCATGEEAYSLAISLQEFMTDRAETFPIKILATDLSEQSLERARAGIYVDNIELDVSPERLARFFVRTDAGHYQICKAVRDLCVFSRHNLAGDPPFSHLDLVSRRNVLIYLDTPLQRRVLPVLHYALESRGFLFLGGSENIGPFTDLFATVDAKYRLFAKKPGAGLPPIDFSSYVAPEGRGLRPGREDGGLAIWSALDVQREADRIVLARYAPVGVVIDESMTVVQFRGRTSPYLEPAPGMASLDMLRMLREGLLADARVAIAQAKASNVAVVKDALRPGVGEPDRRVRLEVIPFKAPPSGVRFFLVLFQEQGPNAAPPSGPAERAAPDGSQTVPLEQEVAALREYLQAVIEEQESTNEELKSANEEILSANEELQSTNEELQTAKEEAQSANEELITVNDELRHRNAELGRVNSDLLNVLTGVNIPIVMVSRDLRIRRFTPLAEKLFNLIPSDLGRPISDIQSNLRVPDLGNLLRGVIDTLEAVEAEVQDRDGRWYSLRVRPYITTENKIDGASVVLLDIDAVKTALETARNDHAPGES